jgi:hypothetical protein
MPRLRDVGTQSLDLLSKSVIPEGTSPETSERIARRMLELTPLGYSQVIRVEMRPRTLPDGSTIQSPLFVLSHTGEEFTDLAEAVRRSNDFGMVSYARLSADPDARINRQLPYGELLEERKKISEVLTEAKKNPRGATAKALRDLGLGEVLDGAQLKTYTRPGGRSFETVDFEIRAMSIDATKGVGMDAFRVGGDSAGEMLGIASTTDDGFNFLEYGLPGQKMTQTQIAAIKSFVGSPRMSPYELAAKGGKEGGIESLVQKLTKRNRGYESPRQFSMSGTGVQKFLRGSGKATLADATVMVDARAEMLTAALASKLNTSSTATKEQKSIANNLTTRYNAFSYKFYHDADLAAAEGSNILDAILDPSKTNQKTYTDIAKLMRTAHTRASSSR